MIGKIIIIALISMIAAVPPYGGHGGGDGPKVAIPYNFAYGVKDGYYGNNFGHTESGDGYNVKGEYYVNLPDGRLQKVSYFTDEWGYHPTVTYEGKAQFPSHPVKQGGGYH